MRKSTTPRSGRLFWPLMLAGLVLLAGSLWWATQQAQVSRARFADLGGPFELIDHDGNRFTEQNLRGKYTLLYFGYTYCPDVCPTELSIISETLNMLGELRDRLRVVMVSVDPERDTPEVLKDYMSNFGPEFIGLTGRPEQIRQMARNWRAFYRKVPGEDGQSYTMDHSAITFLLDEQGNYVRHFAYATPPDVMARDLRRILSGKPMGQGSGNGAPARAAADDKSADAPATGQRG